jgi:peptidoglycan/LPS O-acetylase OafA/YrhL
MSVEAKRLDNIQVLRAIAALMVCAFHLQYLFMGNGEPKPFPNGEMGVQVFFIISGLIMYHTTRKSDGTPGKSPWIFALNRIIRIVPLYLLVTFVYVADDWSPTYLKEQATAIWKTVFFVPPMTETLGPKYGYPLLDVGWTLNYEMFFYLLFFISLFFKRSGYRVLLVLFAVFGLLIPMVFKGGFNPDYRIYHDYPLPFLNLFCNPMIFLFASGVAIGMVMDRISWNLTVRKTGFFITTGLFIVHVIGFLDFPVGIYSDMLFIFPWVFFTALCDRAGCFMFSSTRWIGFGSASYSLYLWHPVVFAYVRWIAEKLSIPYMESPWLSFVIGITIAAVVAQLSFKYLESIITQRLKSGLLPK